MGPRVIAYYLPQFYPTPENDQWWGPGFTEWVSVANARPLYPGHAQPRLPGELGFYDLRLPETREAQAALARAHGVHAFCYWHYWFGDGVRALDRPFAEVLASGEPDFPFCLAWANHRWDTSTWRTPGRSTEVIIEQRYPGDDDHRRHFDTLLPAFLDRRYVTVDGKPLFAVFEPEALPDAAHVAELWREMATDAGLPGLFLLGRSRRGHWSPAGAGFDGAIASMTVPQHRSRRLSQTAARLRPDWLLGGLTRRSRLVPAVYSYARWSPFIPWILDGSELSFPTVSPGWDNTPRAHRAGSVYHGATPELFGLQVRRALDLVATRPADQQLVFAMAWNEWAEGAVLEPDRTFGRGFLEALRDAVNSDTPGLDT